MVRHTKGGGEGGIEAIQHPFTNSPIKPLQALDIKPLHIHTVYRLYNLLIHLHIAPSVLKPVIMPTIAIVLFFAIMLLLRLSPKYSVESKQHVQNSNGPNHRESIDAGNA